VKIFGKLLNRVRSVSMSGYMNGTTTGAPWQSPNFVAFRNTAQIIQPAKRLVLIDEREDSINEGFFGVIMDAPQIGDFPASYHNDAGGINFADGHSEIKKWIDSRTKPPILKGQNQSHLITTPDNPDLIFLQEAASVRI
jgi:hypothetical protein